jgi:hypothetical protein
LTLAEVLASLLIVGGSVTTMLVAQSNSLERINTCQRQLTARHIAHELITVWRLQAEDLVVSSSGRIAGLERWSWRRSAQQLRTADNMAAIEVTLKIIYTDPDRRTTPWVRPYRWLLTDDER